MRTGIKPNITIQHSSTNVDKKHQDEPQDHQIAYPYTRLQLAKQLRIPPKKNEKAINFPNSYQIIKDHLDAMEDYGYDFFYSSRKPFPKGNKFRSCHRQVKLRFYCITCKKNWTSNMGTIEVKFRIQQVQEGQLVNFRLRLYKMGCKNCTKMSEASIYYSHLVTYAKIFCLVVAEILANVPARKREQIKIIRASSQQEEHHLKELCEACFLKVCVAITKK